MPPQISINTGMIVMLRYSLAAVYIWFGALKFFPELSPADQVAKDTIHFLTLGLLPDKLSIILLAIMESSLGILLLWRKWIRFTIYGVFIHLILTFSPFLLFPSATFQYLPYGFTLLGQYIFKNVVLVCAARIIWQSECYIISNERSQAVSSQRVGEKNKKKTIYIRPKYSKL